MKPKYNPGQTVLFTALGDAKQTEFVIDHVEADVWYDDDGNENETYVYYDSPKGESGSMLDESDIDGLALKCCEITEETLIADGWYCNDNFKGVVNVYEKHIEYAGYKFKMQISEADGLSTWWLHVDDSRCETVGSMLVSYIGQIYSFIDILSSNKNL